MTESETEAEIRIGNSRFHVSLWLVGVVVVWLCGGTWWVSDQSHEIENNRQLYLQLLNSETKGAKEMNDKLQARLDALAARVEALERSQSVDVYRLDELTRSRAEGGK